MNNASSNTVLRCLGKPRSSPVDKNGKDFHDHVEPLEISVGVSRGLYCLCPEMGSDTHSRPK